MIAALMWCRCYEYPGEINRRIRWESCTTRSITAEEQQKLPKLAAVGVAEVVKLAKGQMNTLLPKYIPAMIPVGKIGMVGDSAVLEDPSGNRIVLRDRREDGKDHASVRHMMAVANELKTGTALFGLVFYDVKEHRICLHPYSVVTPDTIIRLQY